MPIQIFSRSATGCHEPRVVCDRCGREVTKADCNVVFAAKVWDEYETPQFLHRACDTGPRVLWMPLADFLIFLTHNSGGIDKTDRERHELFASL